MDLGGFLSWFQDQAKILLSVVVIGLVIYMAYQRAWIGLVATLVGAAIISIFVFNPDMVVTLGEWLGDLISIGG